MTFEMLSPNLSEGDAKMQIKQLRSWLFQLNEALKVQFSSLDMDNFASDFALPELSELSDRSAELEKRLTALESGQEAHQWRALECTGVLPWTEGLAPMIIERGGTVSVEGGVKLAASLPNRGTLHVFTLPAPLVPRRRQVLAIFSDNGLFRLDIGTDGRAYIKNLTGGTFNTTTYLSLSCTYSI